MDGINEGIRLFNLARSKCPTSKVVSGGYSQGAALITGSVRRLAAASKTNLAGVVMFGNTRQDEENGKIPNYPNERVLSICAADDGVCDGGLDVTVGETPHFLRDFILIAYCVS